MIKKACEVRVIRDYLLLITFDGDEERIFDCEPLLTDKLYSALANQDFFKTVYVDECGIVSWSDAINLDSFDAFEKSVSAIQFSIIWFFEHYDELTEKHGHKFLVIYAGMVEGAYDDWQIALEQGGKKHRLGTYTVQETGVEHNA